MDQQNLIKEIQFLSSSSKDDFHVFITKFLKIDEKIYCTPKIFFIQCQEKRKKKYCLEKISTIKNLIETLNEE